MAALLYLAASSSFADVTVQPTDCHPTHGCGEAIAAAVQKCNVTTEGFAQMTSCTVILAPGRYRVECPTGNLGQFPYITTPGAVDLSGTSNIIFGALNPLHPVCACKGCTISHVVFLQCTAHSTTLITLLLYPCTNLQFAYLSTTKRRIST